MTTKRDAEPDQPPPPNANNTCKNPTSSLARPVLAPSYDSALMLAKTLPSPRPFLQAKRYHKKTLSMIRRRWFDANTQRLFLC